MQQVERADKACTVQRAGGIGISCGGGFRRLFGVGGLAAVAMTALVLGGCEKSITEIDVEEAVITLPELRRELDKAPGRVILVDPRAPEDFARGHLPGAVSRQLSDVRPGQAPDPEINRFSMQVVYGDNPGSSTARAMTKRMLMGGYRRVRYFADGLTGWRAAGMPVSSSLDAAPAAK